MHPIITNWTDELSTRLSRDIITARHALLDQLSVDDDSLIRLIAAQPRDNIRINLARPNRGEPEWIEGDIGNLSAEDILAAVEGGKHLWLNIINPSATGGIFKNLTSEIYTELQDHCPHFRTRHHSENLLISSPDAMVNYHVDPGPTMLWHLRGRKRVWVYPHHDADYLAQDDLERVCTREWEGWEIPYRNDMDNGARQYNLEPGDFVFWPQHSPHRVENQGDVNVSLTTNHATLDSIICNSVYRANGFFRSRYGLPLHSVKTRGVVPLCKVGAITLARLTRLYSIPRYEPEASFRLNPSVPGGIVEDRAG